MNPTPDVSTPQVGDVTPGTTLCVRPVAADGTPRGDLSFVAVLDVDGLNVSLDGLGAMRRLEGRLYQVATGQAFDLVGLWWWIDEMHEVRPDAAPWLADLIRLGRGDGGLRAIGVRDTPLKQHTVHDVGELPHGLGRRRTVVFDPDDLRDTPPRWWSPTTGAVHPTEETH
jgi:hypothetical protein